MSKSYKMVDWQRAFKDTTSVPGEFPLVYDASLANHAGVGLNVLRVDGTVVWDEGGKLLSSMHAMYPKAFE